MGGQRNKQTRKWSEWVDGFVRCWYLSKWVAGLFAELVSGWLSKWIGKWMGE